MKIKDFIMDLSALVLLCIGLAGCGKDEPKPMDPNNNALNNLVKFGTPGIVPEQVRNIWISTHLGVAFLNPERYGNSQFPSMAFIMETKMSQKCLTYKLYRATSSGLETTGQSRTFSMFDIINMWFGNFIYHEDHSLQIVSCIYDIPKQYSSEVSLTYSYAFPDLSMDFNKINTAGYNPVLSLKPWIEDAADNYCIIAFENENVKTFITETIALLKTFSGKNVDFQIWKNADYYNGIAYISFFPDTEFSNAFYHGSLAKFINTTYVEEKAPSPFEEYNWRIINEPIYTGSDYIFSNKIMFCPRYTIVAN